MNLLSENYPWVLALVALMCAEAVFVFLCFKRRKWLIAARLGVSLFAVTVVLLLLEFVFMNVANANTGGRALSEKIWMDRFWNPINSLGYRDLEPSVEETEKLTKVLFLGDSFTAGHGVKYSETVSSVIKENLQGEQWEVYNAGKNGADTRAELENLKAYPVVPDLVVYQYFGNDINQTALEQGVKPFSSYFYSDIPSIVALLVRRSFFFNFVYWRFPHSSWAEDYYRFQRQAFESTDAVAEHLVDIEKLVNAIAELDAEVVMLLYPNLQDFDISERYMNILRTFCSDRGIQYIDIGEIAEGLSPRDRVVGHNDGHSSAALNRITAEALLKEEFFKGNR